MQLHESQVIHKRELIENFKKDFDKTTKETSGFAKE